MNSEIKKKLAKNWFKILQDMICRDIEEIERGKKFIVTEWKRNKKNEGGGEYRILKEGKIFEKVGVNFSEVYGKFSKEFRNKIPGTNLNPSFWASGISIVMHTKNPHIPAMHFNTRYIYTSHGWFGGGMDITPSIKDARLKNWYHNEVKKCCNRHNKNFYKKYKKWCDEYFYLPHRKETRGIGGIFFDYKKDNWQKDFSFIKDVGITFKKFFKKLLKKNVKKNGQRKIKKFNMKNEADMLNLIYSMIEEQNLGYKQTEMWKQF